MQKSTESLISRAALKSVRAIPNPRPADRRPRSELIATPAEQPPIELGPARNSDFPTNDTNDTNGKAPSQFVCIRVLRGQPCSF